MSRQQPIVASVKINDASLPMASVKHPYVELNVGGIVSAVRNTYLTTRVPIHKAHLDKEITSLVGIDKVITTQATSYATYEAECRSLVHGSKIVIGALQGFETQRVSMKGTLATVEAALRNTLREEVEYDERRVLALSEAEIGFEGQRESVRAHCCGARVEAESRNVKRLEQISKKWAADTAHLETLEEEAAKKKVNDEVAAAAAKKKAVDEYAAAARKKADDEAAAAAAKRKADDEVAVEAAKDDAPTAVKIYSSFDSPATAVPCTAETLKDADDAPTAVEEPSADSPNETAPVAKGGSKKKKGGRKE